MAGTSSSLTVNDWNRSLFPAAILELQLKIAANSSTGYVPSSRANASASRLKRGSVVIGTAVYHWEFIILALERIICITLKLIRNICKYINILTAGIMLDIIFLP